MAPEGESMKDDRGASRESLIDAAARVLSNSRSAIILTGAGISKESGIPTFRDSDGLWQTYRPEELASREGFLSNPSLVWSWYRQRLKTARETNPNAGHIALAELERLLPKVLLITQNVDNLHHRAGSREIVELHGNIERYRCFEYGHPASEDESWGDEPPRCHCGSLIRPDIVWFGEPLPEAELECAFGETGRCDTCFVVGTSGLIYPAAGLPHVAKNAGAILIEVNVEASGVTQAVDIFLEGKSGEILPELVSRIADKLSG
jgi:NAD-dependent deacetylase